ncbi:MAG: methyl-accepting chemotaxis protein [Steroidobacteraceae bacterium]|jgi:methyl-accepting chemotaxis protein
MVAETARAASTLGHEMADIAGTIDDTMKLAKSQSDLFARVSVDVAGMFKGNESIRDEARTTGDTARLTRERVEQALDAAVNSIESGLTAVGGSLHSALGATNDIARIAMRTRMVALNATVQAAHAGSKGSAFGVVAQSVRDLAEQIQVSSRTIAATLAELSTTVNQLASREAAVGASAKVIGLRSAVDTALERFRVEFNDVEQRIHGVASRAEQNLEQCAKVDGQVQSMAAEVTRFEQAIGGAAKKSEGLLGMSANLIEMTALSGAETDDSPFIRTATKVAATLQRLLTEAVGRREISMKDLFDERYEPIRGSNPAQFMTRFVELTDRLFTPIQESVLKWSECVTFCAAVDRNGFLPTHNLKYSKPQGVDPVWNTANCRNRRLFQDRAGSAAGRNTRPFLVQTYRRDMGGGVFAIMKEVDSPITIEREHWGNVRLAYRSAGR